MIHRHWGGPACPGTAGEGCGTQALGSEEATLQMAFESWPELRNGMFPCLTSARILQGIGMLLLGTALGTVMAFPLAMGLGGRMLGGSQQGDPC